MYSFLETQINKSNIIFKTELLYKRSLYSVKNAEVLINIKVDEKELKDLYNSKTFKLELNNKSNTAYNLIPNWESFAEIEPNIWQFAATPIFNNFSTTVKTKEFMF